MPLFGLHGSVSSGLFLSLANAKHRKIEAHIKIPLLLSDENSEFFPIDGCHVMKASNFMLARWFFVVSGDNHWPNMAFSLHS